MDHRLLLVRFLGFLIESQGQVFIDADTVGINIQLSREEKDEIAKLSQEARAAARR